MQESRKTYEAAALSAMSVMHLRTSLTMNSQDNDLLYSHMGSIGRNQTLHCETNLLAFTRIEEIMY